ncbi:MAG: YggN family protein [Luteimonas sp.]|nr:YggN family protein [Luteimonas sp.]
MKMIVLGCALSLACGSALAAGNISVDCDVHSDYDFALTPKSVILTRKDGVPKTVLMRQGRLFIDDRWVDVSPADRDRLAEYERQARATMPLAAQIGQDAATIAFTALGEVAKGFSRDPAATEAKLKQARADLDRSLARSVSATHFNSAELGKGIGEAVSGVIPRVVGDIVGGALRAALGGDTEYLEQLDNLDARIDAVVEPRARALERNAETLCRNMQSLDRIDDALEYRHDGKPLELLRVEVKDRAKPAH